MLGIRKEQMEELASASRQRFIDRMSVHLNAVFPDRLNELPALQADDREASLKNLIVELIDKAAERDIVSERDVARYIDFIIEFGQAFEKNRDMRWATQILANKRLSGSARISLIYEQLPFRFPESRLLNT